MEKVLDWDIEGSGNVPQTFVSDAALAPFNMDQHVATHPHLKS